jgi:paraquat-inducible protein B
MARRANPAVIGGFVIGALTLAVVGLVLFGSGRFLHKTKPLVAYFEGSVKGVSIGAPVTFKGAKVGAVTDLQVVVDTKKHTITTPVYFEIDPARLRDVSGGAYKMSPATRKTMKRLFEQGLRAELEMQSFVTGQVGIALDFDPDTPVRLTGLSKDVLEVPTVPSDIEKFTRTIQEIPIAEITTAAKETLETVRAMVQSPETRAMLASLHNASRRSEEALAAAEKLIRRVDGQVEPLMAEITATAKSARGALGEAQTALARLTPTVESAMKDYQALAQDGRALIHDGQGLIRDAQTLAKNADERLGKLTVSLDRTLAGLDRTLSGADEVIGEGSTMRVGLETALDDLSDAAQSIRVLADYLERNPNALVFGKGRSSR